MRGIQTIFVSEDRQIHRLTEPAAAKAEEVHKEFYVNNE
jgi:hypothetical protein